MTQRLHAVENLAESVARPSYDRTALGAGIVHIGLGAFHKAHQAVYTDDALAAAGGDWRIIGVSLRSAVPAEELAPQDGLFTVIQRSEAGSKARVIGAIAMALCLKTQRQDVLAALVAPETRIVSITVTEKGYGIDRSTGGIDRNHPAIAADLANPEEPSGLAGLLVWALGHRRAAGIEPFTVLSCDNLPENGPLVRGLLTDFARNAVPELADYITGNVAFPATMVDRITPARSAATLDLAREMTGRQDEAAVECEDFHQWVIEDNFPTGRPAWEAGGAIFVDKVRPYEEMKLRMLNGAHSMLAYSGFLAGHKYVRDVMADPDLAVLVHRHLLAAASTLDPLPGVDFRRYALELESRFRNPHLGHETFQIAMDGTEKMPQRIFAPAADAVRKDLPLGPFALATASWMRYTLGCTDHGKPYALRDPREEEIRQSNPAESAEEIATRLLGLSGFCPELLRENPEWMEKVISNLDQIMALGMETALSRAAALQD